MVCPRMRGKGAVGNMVTFIWIVLTYLGIIPKASFAFVAWAFAIDMISIMEIAILRDGSK